MKRFKLLIVAMFLSTLIIGNADALTVNLIQNGDFEDNGGSLNYWDTSGGVQLWTNPNTGNHMAGLGLGITGGDSLISQAFTIIDGFHAYSGQSLSFDYRFDYIDTSIYQFDIFAALVDNSIQVLLASLDTSTWDRDSGHIEQLLIPQLTAGTYTLEFVLSEANGVSTNSLVKLDNIALTAQVPEPSMLILLGSALIGVAGLGRRRFESK